MAILVAAIIPAIPAAVGLAFGIARDGSPMRAAFWTAGPGGTRARAREDKD